MVIQSNTSGVVSQSDTMVSQSDTIGHAVACLALAASLQTLESILNLFSIVYAG